MGKYDKERKALGISTTVSASSVSTAPSKYAAERETILNPKSTNISVVDSGANQEQAKKDQERVVQGKLKALGLDYTGLAKNTAAVMQGVDTRKKEFESLVSSEKKAKDDIRKADRAKLPPVLKQVIQGLDWVGEKTKPAADIAMELYTPGAGIGVINSLTKGAGFGIAKAAPKLANSALGRGVAYGAQEAVVGAPLGVANTLARNPEASNRELLEGAVYSGAGGALIGSGGKLLGEGIKAGLRSGLNKVAAPALDSVVSGQNAINEVARENIPQSVRRVVSKDAVPEVFPERARRDFGTPKPAEPSIVQAVEEGSTPSKYAQERASVQSVSQSPQQGIRGNFANQLDNGNFSPELQQVIRNTDQRYDVKTDQAAVDTANEAVKNLSKAESDFLLNQSGGKEHIATGYRLMQELDALGEHERALVIARKQAEDLTKSGQTQQAASILSRLSPEGQLLNLIRTAEKNGKEVSVADSVKFKQLAAKVQENSGAGIRENQFNGILNRMERGEDVSVDDIKKLSNYLSGAEKVIKPSKHVKVIDDIPEDFKDVRKRDRVVSFLDDAEQSALARIAARKNNLNALPLNEWADHAIVVSAQIAKGTIKAATHVEDLVKLFGEEIRPVATQVFRKAQGLVKGVSKGAGQNDLLKANQAFERISGQSKEMNVQEKVVEKYLRENPKVSPKDIDILRNLAKNVTKLSGNAKIDADISMQKILNSYEKSSVWDKTLALRYMGMLLNTHTQMINAASGPIMATTGVVADVFGSMLDVAMNKMLRTPRATTTYGTNPLRFISDYMKNLTTGAKAGWQGVNPAGIQSTNEIRGLAFPSLKNPLTTLPSIAERTLGAVAKGADYATYKTVFDVEIRKQGFLDAKNSGIKGRQNIKNHVREFVNNPPDKAIEQADRIGKNTTFQRSDTTGGKVANFLNNAPPLVKPGVNAVFPFVRTPINIASTAVTMTPAGIIKGLFQLTSKSDATRREAIRTLSMGVTGTGIGAIGYYLSQLGIITGANDSGNKDADNIREQAGKGKYRFNTSALSRYLGSMFNGEGSEAAEKAAQYREGDRAFDYNKLQPLAFPLAIGAGANDNKDKGIAGQISGAGADAFGSLFGMSTLKGVQQVFQPSYGGTQGEKALGVPSRIAESFFKSFSPGGLAQEAKRQDPIQRKTPFNDGIVKNTTDYFKSRIPGMSQSLPSRKTTLGQDYKNAPGIKGSYLNPYRSEVAPYNKAAEIISGLIDRTGDLTLAPSAPAKTVRGKDRTGTSVSIAIPADRYAKLQEDVGNEIVKKISELPAMDDDKLATRINDIYSIVREKEMDKVKRELGIRIS
jgi:hypothetical protein